MVLEGKYPWKAEETFHEIQVQSHPHHHPHYHQIHFLQKKIIFMQLSDQMNVYIYTFIFYKYT